MRFHERNRLFQDRVAVSTPTPEKEPEIEKATTMHKDADVLWFIGTTDACDLKKDFDRFQTALRKISNFPVGFNKDAFKDIALRRSLEMIQLLRTAKNSE